VTRYVLLLRAVNVGRANRVGMAPLRELLTARGYGGVRTHLQSGNVVLDTDRTADELTADVEAAVTAAFGFAIPVVARTGPELDAVLAADPLAGTWTDPARYSVTFLTAAPDPALVAALPPSPRADEVYRVVGRELFLWLPEGVHRSALGTWPWDRLLGQAGTARNWNTVRKLAELARTEPSAPGRTPEQRLRRGSHA
jgi:uncharacterized protein (DUF1697 family)